MLVDSPDWRRRYRGLAIAGLGFTLAVILWGAFVRITGAGAGCGSHWPTCNGEVVPHAPTTKTLIEFTHRLTSAASGLFTLLNLLLAFIFFPKRSLVRVFAVVSALLMASEAGIGAALVLFEHVATDARIGRAYWMSLHLINTFLLIASMMALVLAARLPVRDLGPSMTRPPRPLGAYIAGAVGTLMVGVTGAISALGDTLFPATSLAEGMRADFDPQAHAFVALRTLHPFVAVLTALGLLFIASRSLSNERRDLRRSARLLALAVVAQVSVGALNLLLLAPAVMQLIHLFAADVVWLALVQLAFVDLLVEAPRVSPTLATGGAFLEDAALLQDVSKSS